MNRAIIYCRKSTDRDDKQQNSIESQLSACTRVLEQEWCSLIDTLFESASAKKSGTRPIFDSMVSLCKKWKVDFIIVDEVSRLSRNNTDSVKVLGLLEEGYIKGIYTSSQKYFWEQVSELFMLLLNFWMAKFDNDTRARNVKARMITCVEKGKCVYKAPFGYQNVTKVQDGKIVGRWVEIDKETSNIVKEMFQMRWEQKRSTPDISTYFQNKYGSLKWFTFSYQALDRTFKNPFYIGMMRYSGKIYQGEHEPIISSSLFQKVANLERGFYSYNKEIKIDYLYKWMIKDEFGITLTSEIKKDKYIYYRSQNLRSSARANISQKKVQEAIIQRLKEFYIPKEMYPLFAQTAKELLSERVAIHAEQTKGIDLEIWEIRIKEKRLMDGYLEWVISNEDYKVQKANFSEKIVILLAQKRELQSKNKYDIEKRIWEMFELIESLSERYEMGNSSEKAIIHAKIEIELFINTKKELVIQENKLFSEIKNIDFSFGLPDKDRTCV